MGTRTMVRTGAFGLLLGLLASGASAGERDAELKQRIEARLARAKLAEHAQVAVTVQEGRATLTGFATTLDARARAERAALKEVAEVRNQLQVVAGDRPEAEVRKAVEDAITRYPYYGVFDAVGADFAGGTLVLRGSVRHPWRRDDIEREVSRVEGVTALRNELAVQSLSLHDDRLRADLYARIYGHALFVTWAGHPDPPVRILVDRGRVTLAGWVGSEVERVALGAIARGSMAFAVDNQVQLESERGRAAEAAAKTIEKS